MWARWKAVYAAGRLDLRLTRLRREEDAALAQAGRLFRTATFEPGLELAEPVSRALAGVLELEERLRVVTERLAASLEADRRDYRATNSALGRWLIIARGILDRLVLRDEAYCARRVLPARQIELGNRALDDEACQERLAYPDRQRALEARAAVRQLLRERAELLTPWGGHGVPGWLRSARAELGNFAGLLKEEVGKRIFLRLPALAAMGAAWWLTQRFTSLRFEANLNRFTGEGRTGLPDVALEQLHFWLPLVVTALVTYVLATLSKRIDRRYRGEAVT